MIRSGHGRVRLLALLEDASDPRVLLIEERRILLALPGKVAVQGVVLRFAVGLLELQPAGRLRRLGLHPDLGPPDEGRLQGPQLVRGMGRHPVEDRHRRGPGGLGPECRQDGQAIQDRAREWQTRSNIDECIHELPISNGSILRKIAPVAIDA